MEIVEYAEAEIAEWPEHVMQRRDVGDDLRRHIGDREVQAGENPSDDHPLRGGHPVPELERRDVREERRGEVVGDEEKKQAQDDHPLRLGYGELAHLVRAQRAVGLRDEDRQPEREGVEETMEGHEKQR